MSVPQHRPGRAGADALCAMILAAGSGTRLRPITETVPKALCPVGNVALLDLALARLARHGFLGPATVAVNACHLADQVRHRVDGRAHVSVEPTVLGTAGALAKARDWIDGRGVLVGNADAYLAPAGNEELAPAGNEELAPAGNEELAPAGNEELDLADLLAGWDGATVRLLAVPAGSAPDEFDGHRFAGFSLVPAQVAVALPVEVAELVLTVWRPAQRAGRLELIRYRGRYLDTGTPAGYLAANLDAAGPGSIISAQAEVTGQVHHSVVGAGAVVRGAVSRSVIWPGARVDAHERLTEVIRIGADLTVSAAGAHPELAANR